jgi:hypothetical protein
MEISVLIILHLQSFGWMDSRGRGETVEAVEWMREEGKQSRLSNGYEGRGGTVEAVGWR